VRAPSRLRIWRAHLPLLLALLAAPTAAAAHGTPIDIATWGDFPPAIARCQRVIGRAAAVCGLRVWRARRDCALAPLRGTPCDGAATEAALEAARVAALDDVSHGCTPMQVSNLQFLDVREAQADVIRFCRELDAAANSLILEPLAAATAADAACGAAATGAAGTLLAMSFRSRQHVLDRIAVRTIRVPDKRAMLNASAAAIGDAATALATTLTSRCDGGRFAALYQRTPGELLAAVAVRADCLAGDAYAQGAVLCPAPICGNRIRERAEECDDGNAEGGDGCSADCLREVS
jgi:cysteine-rich repeat protein